MGNVYLVLGYFKVNIMVLKGEKGLFIFGRIDGIYLFVIFGKIDV